MLKPSLTFALAAWAGGRANRISRAAIYTLVLTGAFGVSLAQGLGPASILEVDLENFVLYDYDVMDYTKMSTDPNLVRPLPMRTFGRHLTLSDIVSVNGTPARGTCVFFSRMLNLRPNPSPGQSMADITRAMLDDFGCEFQQENGTPVGAIMGYGFSHGTPPPGAPLMATGFNYAITGGTGAYLGARGQVGWIRSVTPRRDASVTEDTANRRVHGGGTQRIVIHIIPMAWPAVQSEASGAASFHSDLSPVTPERPARPGEWLIMAATGLGPTRPGVDPGKPFPPFESGKELLVNSPVEVMVNGKATQVRNTIGWPQQTNLYRVDFRVPEDTLPGMTTISMKVAWIAGPEVKIPVR